MRHGKSSGVSMRIPLLCYLQHAIATAFPVVLPLMSMQGTAAETLSVVLQNGLNGYAGCDDSYIVENATDPVGNHTKLSFKYGCSDCSMVRSVIRFAIPPSIPATASITGAVLSLYCYYDSLQELGGPTFVFQISKQWEKSSVTWFQASTGRRWDSGGGDYREPAVCYIMSQPNAENTWEHYHVTSAVREFHRNPSTNFGFLIMIFTKNKEDFYSSGYMNDKTLRPKLTISYVPQSSIHSDALNTGAMPSIRCFKNSLHLSTLKPQRYTVGVYDGKGKTVRSENVSGPHHVITLRGCAAGLYIVRISHNYRDIAVKKILIMNVD